MSFRPIVLLLGLSISFVGGLNREAAAESLATGCQARPSGLLRSEGRWMYRLLRATGEKCWFRAGIGRAQRTERVTDVAASEAQIDPEESTVQACVATPTGPAPRTGQWRYRFARGTNQRCWRLSRVAPAQIAVRRARTSLRGQSMQIEEDNLLALRSVSGAQASLLEPDDMGVNAANVARVDVPQGTSGPAQATTFASRWIAPTEFNPSIDATIRQWEMAVSAPDGRERAEPDTRRPLTDRASMLDAVRVSGLLIATVASIAIATGLYASINGSASSIGWMRGRASAFRSREDMRDHRLLPPRDHTMADILERLSREDDPDLSGMPRTAMPEADHDRFVVSAKAPTLDFAGDANGTTDVNEGFERLSVK